MNERISAGIDIGGTKANIGLVKENGIVINSEHIPVQRNLSPEQFIAEICDNLDKLIQANGLKLEEIESIGVGVPGTADITTGYVEYCPNLRWEDVPAGALFKKYLGREVIVSQDARLAAWAEYLFGAGRKYKSFICVTLGTGIGAGIILDGRIFHGSMNTAGEIGHFIFE